MRSLCCIALLLLGTAVFGAEKPNIVFLLADDLGVNDLGTFNPTTFYETPRLNRLAEEGMRFTTAYTAGNVCSPTRYSIMTGKYPVRSGITNHLGNNRSERFDPSPMAPFMALEEKTLGNVFKDAGYRTAYVGKWHLGGKVGPARQGFDIVSGDTRFLSPEYEKIRFVQDTPITPDDPMSIETKTARITRDALTVLDTFHSMEKKPFLLYLSYYQVHVPLGASEKYVEPYRKKKAKLGLHDDPDKDFADEMQNFVSTDEPRKTRIRQTHEVYAGMVSQCDECVGLVLDKLDQLGLSENTIVVFLSDNGGVTSSEGFPTSNLPFRCGKGWMYEGGIRTPLIVRYPRSVKPNIVCDTPVISTDIYPTLLDLAGLSAQPKQHLDGVSFAPLLRGEKKDLPQRDFFWHYPHYGNQGGFPSSAIRAGDYKLIQRLEDGRVHLFDLKNDIGEQNDLAEKMPEKVAELRQRLFDWYKETGARFLEPRDGQMPWQPE